MNTIEKIVAYSVFVPVAILVGSTLVPRQYWLKVKLDSIPDAIKKLHVIKMPFWFLNFNGRLLIISFWGSVVLWLTVLVFAVIQDAL